MCSHINRDFLRELYSDVKEWLPVLYLLVTTSILVACTGFSLIHLIWFGGSSGGYILAHHRARVTELKPSSAKGLTASKISRYNIIYKL